MNAFSIGDWAGVWVVADDELTNRSDAAGARSTREAARIAKVINQTANQILHC